MATKNATVFQIIRTGQNYSGRLDPRSGTIDSRIVEVFARLDDGNEVSITQAADDDLQDRHVGDRLILRPSVFNSDRMVVVGKLIF